MKKIKVLFVCLGNICRSPLAEAIFKDKIRSKKLDNYFEADSSGTSNYHIGSRADQRTIANATKNGITIDHCGRQLTDDDLHTFDFILAMDQSNLDNIMRLPSSKSNQSKIHKMRDFDLSDIGGNVPDPYHGGEEGFQQVFDILDRSISRFVSHLEKTIPGIQDKASANNGLT